MKMKQKKDNGKNKNPNNILLNKKIKRDNNIDINTINTKKDKEKDIEGFIEWKIQKFLILRKVKIKNQKIKDKRNRKRLMLLNIEETDLLMKIIKYLKLSRQIILKKNL